MKQMNEITWYALVCTIIFIALWLTFLYWDKVAMFFGHSHAIDIGVHQAVIATLFGLVAFWGTIIIWRWK